MNARGRRLVVAFLALIAMGGAVMAVLTSVHFGH
jgi:hypothetical protein